MNSPRKHAPTLESLFDWSGPAPGTSTSKGSEARPSLAQLRSMDRELAWLGRSEGRAYLHLGDLLERFARLGGPTLYGYSSRGYYATQVLGRGSRWAGDLCALSRAVEELPLIRAALAMGRLGRSMATLLAKHVPAEDDGAIEASLLVQAQGRTVRAMTALLKDAAAQDEDGQPEEARSTIQITVPVSDAWAYEFVKILLDRGLGCRGRDEAIEAMLAEAALTLDLLDPDLDVPIAPPEHPAAEWRHERAQEAARVEADLEHRLDLDFEEDPEMADKFGPLTPIGCLSDDVAVLHAELKALVAELAGRDLGLGVLAERFWKADGWRRLGFTRAAPGLRHADHPAEPCRRAGSLVAPAGQEVAPGELPPGARQHLRRVSVPCHGGCLGRRRRGRSVGQIRANLRPRRLSLR